MEKKTDFCEKHGQSSFYLEKQGKNKKDRWRCGKCRYESQQRSIKSVKQKVVTVLGGKCRVCGYSKCLEALEFHHADPSGKERNVSKFPSSYPRALQEAKKCVLLCANCHREVEYGITKCPDMVVVL